MEIKRRLLVLGGGMVAGLLLFATANACASSTRANSRVQLVLQTNERNCGLAALAMLLSVHHEAFGSLADLEAAAAILLHGRQPPNLTQGYSVGELQRLTRAYGLTLLATRVGFADFKQLKLPVIAYIHVEPDGHFTVVERWVDDTIALADPTRGRLSVSVATWERLWLKGASGLVLAIGEHSNPP